MADNVTVDNGALTDYTVSSDEAASGQVQRVKLALSADGSDTHVTADADGLLVNLGANNDVTVASLPLPSGAATAANQTTIIGHVDGIEGLLTTIDADTGNIATSVAAVAGAVSGTEMQVDVLTMPTVTVDSELTTADVDTGAGTDTRAVVGLVGTASGGGQLIPGSSTDGLLVNLGANNDVTVTGTVTANLAAGTNNVGDVDVASVPAPLSTTGGGTEATALRVTIASDSTGVVSVDDGGGALTVDGDVTISAGVAVTGVTPGGAASSLGKAEDNPHSTADIGVMALAVRRDTAAVGSSLDGDYSTLNVNASGRLYTSATVDAALPAGTNNIGDVDVLTVPAPLSTTGGGTEATALRVTVASDSTGVLSVDDNGGALTVDNGGTFAVQPTAGTTGGCTPYKNLDVDESEDEVKGSAGQLFWIHAMNLAATKRYLKIYNNTAAGVTVGTTVPDLTFPLPTMGDTNGAGFTVPFPVPIAMGTGITIAATTGFADNDTGAPGANEVIVNLGYA